MSPTGSVLSPGDFTISPSATVRYDSPPAVAFTGNKYLVAWTGGIVISGAYRYRILGTYITPASVVTPPSGFQISSVPVGVPNNPAIGAGGKHMLLGWTDLRNVTGPLFNNTDIYGQMVPP